MGVVLTCTSNSHSENKPGNMIRSIALAHWPIPIWPCACSSGIRAHCRAAASFQSRHNQAAHCSNKHRRVVLSTAIVGLLLPLTGARAVERPVEPPVGNCIECIGEVSARLHQANAAPLQQVSYCTSVPLRPSRQSKSLRYTLSLSALSWWGTVERMPDACR